MRTAVAGAAAVAAALAGFGVAASQAATPQKVAVQMNEFRFGVSPKTVKKGVVVFSVANRGTIAHDFKIGGRKAAVLAAGSRGTLRVTFTKAGRYPYLCTLPSHAAAGMKGVLVVK